MQPKPLVLPQGGFEKTRPNKHHAVLIWQDRVSKASETNSGTQNVRGMLWRRGRLCFKEVLFLTLPKVLGQPRLRSISVDPI